VHISSKQRIQPSSINSLSSHQNVLQSRIIHVSVAQNLDCGIFDSLGCTVAFPYSSGSSLAARVPLQVWCLSSQYHSKRIYISSTFLASQPNQLIGELSEMASAVTNEPQSVFDRQTRIPDWDQSVIQSQVALVLGCGGLGCSVALSCCRLGFKKIILVDYDTVAIHNLNRQILFSVGDVGKPKVRIR
jgi:hypothetical protein